MTAHGEREAVISGIGQSDVGRRLHRPGVELTLDAAVAAEDHCADHPDQLMGLAVRRPQRVDLGHPRVLGLVQRGGHLVQVLLVGEDPLLLVAHHGHATSRMRA